MNNLPDAVNLEQLTVHEADLIYPGSMAAWPNAYSQSGGDLKFGVDDNGFLWCVPARWKTMMYRWDGTMWALIREQGRTWLAACYS